jgi:hypothetical protein
VALVAKRTYRLTARQPEVAPEQEPVQILKQYERSSNAGAGRRLAADSDLFGIAKPLTDVLVRGSAHSARGPVTRLDTSVEVGAARKSVRVFGARRVQLGAGGRLSFSAPERFESMPLTWDQAFGGRDAHAETKLFPQPEKRFGRGPADERPTGSIVYPRNYAGRGYFIDVDRERIDGQPLPNLEDPEDPVTPDRLLHQGPHDWIDGPAAACYEPIDPYTFPRAAFFLLPVYTPAKRPVRELAQGALLPADLDPTPRLPLPPNPRLYNCAPSGLAVCRLSGGERVRLRNLHPKHEVLEFDLPAERPSLFVELPNIGAKKLDPVLQTVSIEPDRERLTMTWTGTLDVAVPFPQPVLEEMRHAAVYRDP